VLQPCSCHHLAAERNVASAAFQVAAERAAHCSVNDAANLSGSTSSMTAAYPITFTARRSGLRYARSVLACSGLPNIAG
jgi:hypothetical protein